MSSGVKKGARGVVVEFVTRIGDNNLSHLMCAFSYVETINYATRFTFNCPCQNQ